MRRRRQRATRRAAVALAAALAAGGASVVPAAGASTEGLPEPGFGGAQELVVDADGAWSWFQDERAILDGCRLVVGTTSGGRLAHDGDIEVHEVDLDAGWSRAHLLASGLPPDDHHAPAVLRTGSGSTLVSWSAHGLDQVLRTARRPAGGALFETTEVPRGAPVSYANLVELGGGAIYDVFRAEGLDPNVIRSWDDGRTWSDLGRLFLTPDASRPYLKYAGDGARLHMLVTPTHPQESRGGYSGVYHGYLENGRVHRSDGVQVGRLGERVRVGDLTPVMVPPLDQRAWPSDLAVVDGVPVAAFTLQEGMDLDATRRVLHARWDGSSWQVADTGDAGSALYAGQAFYTGTVALDPTEPDRMYLAADVDPATGEAQVSSADGRRHWELFEGRSPDDGASWVWTALTSDSTVDNLRPVVPVPSAEARALVWLRGDYRTYLDYDLEVVARVVRHGDASTCSPRSERDLSTTAEGLSGDFDGDGRLDALFYGRGAQPDHLALADGHGGFASRSITVHGDGYRPVAGDFDGNGVDDVLWYGPGGAFDTVWWGSRNRGFVPFGVVVRGQHYRPVAGDFDGNGVDDVLWYGPGPEPDYVWWGDRSGFFTSQPTAVHGAHYEPVAGDFDGDGVDDVLWYGPGAVPDSWWWGSAQGFRPVAEQIPGAGYRTAAGDLDGDGVDDVVWVGGAGAGDAVWFGEASRTPARVAVDVVGSPTPLVVDLDGEGGRDLWWHVPGPGAESAWSGGADRRFRPLP